MDRREFLAASGAGAALLALPAHARIRPRGSGPGTIWVDGLGGIDGFDDKEGRLVPSARLIEAVKAGWINHSGRGRGRLQPGRGL